MGEEADADWQDGLGEWSEEDTRRWMADKMEEAIRKAYSGPVRKQRQTALRVRGRTFETVELDDAGKVIKPLRCTCGGMIIMHRPACPFYCMVT